MNPKSTVNIARTAFACLCCLLGISVSLGFKGDAWIGAVAGSSFGLLVVILDNALKNFSFRGFSTGTFGLLVGLFCAWLVNKVDFWETPGMEHLVADINMASHVTKLILYLALGFLGITFALRSKREEFSLIIPYVRFRQDSVHDQPLLVDTNIIIDGRIPRICETGFLGGSLIVPRFVVDELHVLADSNDPIKRERGKRGLDSLNQMQSTSGLDVAVHEDYQDEEKLVDRKLIQLARRLGARILTNDANLGKVARLQGVPVLNLIELAKAMRPVVVPGDHLELTLVKEGKDKHQAIGYLPDGTMIVVNNAADQIHTTVDVVVAGSLQTSAGRLIFAELKANMEKKEKEKQQQAAS